MNLSAYIVDAAQAYLDLLTEANNPQINVVEQSIKQFIAESVHYDGKVYYWGGMRYRTKSLLKEDIFKHFNSVSTSDIAASVSREACNIIEATKMGESAVAHKQDNFVTIAYKNVAYRMPVRVYRSLIFEIEAALGTELTTITTQAVHLVVKN